MSYTGRADEVCHQSCAQLPLSYSRQGLCLSVRHTTKIRGGYCRASTQIDKTQMLSAELILRSEVTR
jgi:hypothetical protein